MRFLPVALCSFRLPWQPNRAVGGKLDRHSLPVSHCAPALRCHSLWVLQGDPVPHKPGGTPRPTSSCGCHRAPLQLASLLRLQLLSLGLAQFSRTGTPGQSENDSTMPKSPCGLVAANRSFLIAPGKVAGDGSSTWHGGGSSFPPGIQGEGWQGGKVSLQGRWENS